MNRFLTVFAKHHVLILFVFLQSIAVMMIFQGKNYHKSLFINSVNGLTGNTYSAISDYEQYLSLKQANDMLSQENARLKNSLPNSIQRVNNEYLLVSDTLYRQKYLYREALVVYNSVVKKDNYLILNLGSKDGIMEDMGIVTATGVVGRVVEVSDHYAKVMSFLNSKSTISCWIKRNKASGYLVWDHLNSKSAKFTELPLTTEVKVGDTVITSGYSSIYPKGIELGVISRVEDDLEQQMLSVQVDLNLDYNTLYHVCVVENLEKEELKELKKMTND